MRRHPVFAHHVFRLKWIVAAFLLTCFVASVYAGVRVNASGIRSAGATATGVRTTATLEATYSGTVNGVKSYNVPVPVSSTTVGNLAKAALRRGGAALGWYSVFKGIVDAAGWAIDELKQQVVVPGKDAEPLGQRAWCFQFAGQPKACAGSPQSLEWMFRDQERPGFHWIYETINEVAVRIVLTDGNKRVAAFVINYEQMPSNGWGDVTNGNESFNAVPVSDYDLGQLLKQSPQVVNAVLIDPDTGAPIRTQELVDAMNQLRKQLEAANGLDPGVDVQPTDDPTKTEPRESEWPGFCDWATTACDFIDWVKDDKPQEEMELPEQELEIKTSEWSSGVGGGSCPAAEVITVSFAGTSGDVTFDWQPVCKGATLLRPFLIAVSTMVAAFIVAGLRKSAL